MKIRVVVVIDLDKAGYEAEYGEKFADAEIRERTQWDLQAAVEAAPWAHAVRDLKVKRQP
jgi:hypothetical protein